MKKPLIEICASDLEIAKGANDIGADRIEICHDLSVGGVTPSHEVIKACSQLDILTRVLIRPRAGDFVYSDDEIDQMFEDIEFCRQLKVEGLVIGALNENASLEINVLTEFRSIAGDLQLIFHRGIDHCLEFNKMKKIIDIGFDGVLSSGSVNDVNDGVHELGMLQNEFGSTLEIVAGGGVSEKNIGALLNVGIGSIHFSCQKLATKGSLSKNHNSSDPSSIKHIFDMEKWEGISNKIQSIGY